MSQQTLAAESERVLDQLTAVADQLHTATERLQSAIRSSKEGAPRDHQPE
jgi:hypothetical protein